VNAYIRDMGTAIADPQWMADTGIPLLVTLGGLGLAYVFVRRQLNSDREFFRLQQEADRESFRRQQDSDRDLFRLQQESDRQLRRADHKREAAMVLGNALVESIANIKKFSPSDIVWRSPVWVAKAMLDDAIAQAAVLLPKLELSRISNLVEAISDGWQACWSQGSRDNPDMAYHTAAARSVVEPYTHSLTVIGESLLAWDGEGPMPVAPGIEDPVQSALDGVDHQQRNDRYKEVRSAYLAQVDRISGKAGVLSLAKASGIRLHDLDDPARELADT
jgi:hypothetical protein